MSAYSARKVGGMLRAIDDAASSRAKGTALEVLSKYLFERLRGVKFLRMHILDAPRAHELDVAFFNDQRRSDLAFLDAVLVVECKATEARVGSIDVGWFVRKLQDRGAHHGILVALNGITGDADGATSAHSEVLTALKRDGIKILLLTRQEIVALASSADLATLLLQKLLALTLDLTVDVDNN
jgi:hypothetical protein